MNFENKHFLIVGGSTGIGLALVKLLSSSGATLYVVSRNPSAEWPDGIKHLSLDITGGTDGLKALLPDMLHGVVYAAGSINLKPFSRLTEKDFIDDYRINVLGAAQVIQHALHALKNARAASIVLFSSVAATTGMPYHASISAAKAAVEGLALSLAAELAAQQIRVNVIAPSLTATPLSGQLLNTPEKQAASAKRHPLGRYGEPADISQAAAFLLADESSWMTGQVIGIDGGLGKLKIN